MLKGLSDNGGYSAKQLSCLGTHFNQNKGWKLRLIGKEVSNRKVREFLALKNAHINGETVIQKLQYEVKQLKEENSNLKKSVAILTKMVK